MSSFFALLFYQFLVGDLVEWLNSIIPTNCALKLGTLIAKDGPKKLALIADFQYGDCGSHFSKWLLLTTISM